MQEQTAAYAESIWRGMDTALYRDQVGFHLDHDTTNEFMHVVQLTPTGSGCSIVLGDLPTQREMKPGRSADCSSASPTPRRPALS